MVTAVPDTALRRASPAPRPAALTQSLAEQIAAQLAERILSGAAAPAQRILEQSVAAEFAVSRGPVREALRLLEKDGLVTILPRRGAQVTHLSIAEVKEIFDIRAALNGLRDRKIAEDPERSRILPALEAEVGRLTRLVRQSERAEEYVETVARVNRLLTQASRNSRLRSILESLAMQTRRYSQLGLLMPQRRRRSAQNWQQLLKAIRDGDGAMAERVARERILESRDAAIRILHEQSATPATAAKGSRHAA